VNIRVILQVICLIINTWCIPAKLRLPNNIFTHAGSHQEAVAVQLPKSPWWPPLARHILFFLIWPTSSQALKQKSWSQISCCT
jgi:hypothetical protein